jgi:hypothetical protein
MHPHDGEARTEVSAQPFLLVTDDYDGLPYAPALELERVGLRIDQCVPLEERLGGNVGFTFSQLLPRGAHRARIVTACVRLNIHHFTATSIVSALADQHAQPLEELSNECHARPAGACPLRRPRMPR